MSNPRADDSEASLLAKLRGLIRRDGPMPVDRYMRIGQADPEHGYWYRARSIGAEGDFITAPEISQVFGELIGLWCAVAWQIIGKPAPVRLIELGPGRGTLMRDALRAAGRVPEFLDSLSVHLIEASAPLREAQRLALWGTDREDGIAENQREGFPPPLAPPHKGEGNIDGASATASPPPLWGRDREGGSRQPQTSGVPPPLAPPHKGE